MVPRSQVVDDGPIDHFIRTLSSLSAEEWQRRIESLQTLLNSTPDYSTTYSSSNDDGDETLNNTATPIIIPWYRSSKSVRRLAPPLKTLLLDARSAVVKEASELIGVLLSVKLQCHPSSSVTATASNKGENHDEKKQHDEDKHDQLPPPPPFVGRLLFKDLLPSILQLSSQTVKVIRTYGINMTLQIIPHCRVISALVILVERLKSDKNRNVREDCARYLRCVLETWPVDEIVVLEGGGSSITGSIHQQTTSNTTTTTTTTTRSEEQLSYETIQQIGMGLGRALTDPAQPVRNETKRGFQVLFQRYRSVWNEVMNSGVIRDVRLRKNLLEAASRSEDDNNNNNNNGGGGLLLFDDMASLGDLSLNTSTSFTSMRSNTSYRSYASRGLGVGGGGASVGGGGGGGRAVPSVIGTPKVTRKYGVPSSRFSPSASTTSPSYTRATATTSSGSKIRNKESSSTYSSSTYVLSSGHVVSSSTTTTPQKTTSRLPPPSPSTSPRKNPMTPPKQPFASLMQTPQPNKNETTPTRSHFNTSYTNNSIRQSPKSAKMLRKRLSRRISGIDGLEAATAKTTKGPEEYKRQLSSIAEKNDDGNNRPSTTSQSSATNNNVNSNSDEITYVALEVISAHLAHLDKIETQLSREKDLLLDLNKQLGISISDATNSDELAQCLTKLTEEQVCDYFEAVHVCVDLQRNASESLLREMERISQVGGSGGDLSMSSSDVMDTTSADGSSNGVCLPQSPLSLKNSNGLERVQRDLGAQF